MKTFSFKDYIDIEITDEDSCASEVVEKEEELEQPTIKEIQFIEGENK